MAKRDLNVVAAQYRQDFINAAIVPLDESAACIESPIERAMFWALVREGVGVEGGGLLPTDIGGSLPGAHGDAESVVLISGGGAVSMDMWLQVPVSANGRNYRLDFALVARSNRGDGSIVYVDLELDGHDFHERTKEQAERDKKRDRDLQSIGWQVARFTGSQVYRDPIAVAHEAYGFTYAMLQVAEQRAK
jgi:very-short-patch-repair endonuclease